MLKHLAPAALVALLGCTTTSSASGVGPGVHVQDTSQDSQVDGGQDASSKLDAGTSPDSAADTAIPDTGPAFCINFSATPPGTQAPDGATYTCSLSGGNPCLQQLPPAACVKSAEECPSGIEPLAGWEFCNGLYFCIGIPESQVCACTNGAHCP